MAITKQTARKKHPDPRPDQAATQPAPRNASKRVPRKLSKLWSGTLTERHPHQDVNLADLLYFKKGCDYVNVSSLPDEQGCRYCYIVYFDKVREGVYYGFIRGRKKEYVHFNLLYVQSLTRVPEPCA